MRSGGRSPTSGSTEWRLRRVRVNHRVRAEYTGLRCVQGLVGERDACEGRPPTLWMGVFGVPHGSPRQLMYFN